MRHRLPVLLCALPLVAQAQRGTVDWPVYGGNTDHTHYSTLGQITPANVSRLAGGVDVRDARRVSGLGDAGQSDRRRRRAVRHDAQAPRHRARRGDGQGAVELRRRTAGVQPASRFRHRGVVVTGDRVLFTYRNKLWALDRKTGKPIPSFGVDGAVDLREGLGRPPETLSVSASTPGVVFEDMLIIGSTVSETLPGSPGDIRAYD